MNLIKVLWAKLWNYKLVWLFDYDDEVTLSMIQYNKEGYPYAERWWPYNIKKVYLTPDGGTYNCSYTISWKMKR